MANDDRLIDPDSTTPAPADDLRDRLQQALNDSEDYCARCQHCDRQLNAVLAVVEQAIEDARNYTQGGRCRYCSRRRGEHQMRCRLYVGPLEHKLTMRGINPTFGGTDYDCTCGGWFRKGGIAGHGDGSENAEPVCPNADQDWRGPREESA